MAGAQPSCSTSVPSSATRSPELHPGLNDDPTSFRPRHDHYILSEDRISTRPFQAGLHAAAASWLELKTGVPGLVDQGGTKTSRLVSSTAARPRLETRTLRAVTSGLYDGRPAIAPSDKWELRTGRGGRQSQPFAAPASA